MPSNVLVSAITNHKLIKGEIIHIVGGSRGWGTAETLPKFVRIEVSDVNPAQILNFMERAVNRPIYKVQVQPDLSKQITLTMPAWILSKFGNQRGLTVLFKTHLQRQFGATLVSHPDTSTLIVNVPANTSLSEMKRDILDKLEDHLGPRFLFTGASVDRVISAGGTVRVTKAQAQNNLVDRSL